MCDPLTIAGIGLSVGSTVANSIAANEVQSARNDALAAERIRQKGYDTEAQALNDASRTRYDTADQAVKDTATKLGDYFASQSATTPATAAVIPTSTSDITVQEEANQKDKAKAFTDASGKALGNLRAFGDVLGDFGRKQAREASQVGQLAGFKQGSSNVLGYELDAANHAGDGLKTFADVLGGLGSVGSSAGLGGGTLAGLFAPSKAVVTASPMLRFGGVF